MNAIQPIREQESLYKLYNESLSFKSKVIREYNILIYVQKDYHEGPTPHICSKCVELEIIYPREFTLTTMSHLSSNTKITKFNNTLSLQHFLEH